MEDKEFKVIIVINLAVLRKVTENTWNETTIKYR